MLTKSYSDYQIRELIPDALITLDVQDRFVYVNQIAGDMLERKPMELMGKHIWTEFPEAANQPIHDAYIKARQSKQHIYLEEYNSAHDRWFENHIYQSPGGVSICFSDITERKKKERIFQSNELKYKAFFENSMDGVILGYPDGTVYAANTAACRIFGRTETEICSLGREGLLDTSDPRLKKLVEERKRKGEAEGESTGIKKDGTKFPVGFRTKLVTDSNGIEQTIVIMRDNTELNTAKGKIKEQHSTLQSLIESISNSVFSLDRNYCYTSFNRAHAVEMKAIYGKEIQPGGCLFDYQTEKDAKAAKPNLDRALAGEAFAAESYSGDELYKRLFYEIAHNPVKDNDGNVIGVSVEAKDITKRKEQEDALLASQQITNAIINTIPVGVFWKDRNLNYMGCNQIFAKDAGFNNPADIIGKDDFMNGPHPKAELYRSDDLQILETGYSKLNMEQTEVTADGKQKTIITSKIALRNADEEIIAVLGTYVDITDRKLFEEQLRESEERWRKLVHSVPDFIALHDLDAKFTFLNHYAEGFSEKDVVGKSLYEFISQESKEEYSQYFEECIKTNEVKSFNHKAYGDNGAIRTYENVLVPIVNKNREVVNIMAIAKDITEREKTQDALHSAHQSYFDIFNSSSEAIYILDETGTFIDVNKGAEEMYLFTKGELIGQTPANVAAPGLNDLEEIQQMMQSVTETGKAVCFEFWAVRKNGEVFPKEVLVNRGTYFEKNVLIATARDITERKIAEDAIRASEERYKSIIAASPDGVAITDLEGRILMASPVSVQMFGFKKEEELIGQLITEYVFPDDRQTAANNIALMFQGVMTGLGEYRAVRKDGTVFDMEVNAEFIRDEEADPLQIVLIVRDITLRKLAEEQLKESEHFLNETQRVSRMGSYKLDIEEGLWESSFELRNIFGIKTKGKYGIELWESFIHPDYKQEMHAYLINEVFAKKQRFDKEYKVVNQHNGKEYWVHGIGDLVFNENGLPVKMIGTIQDITEKKEAEEILQTQEKLYRALIENSNDGVVILDGWGKFRYIAPSIKTVLGYDEEELLNTSLLNITHPDDHSKVVGIYTELLTNPGLYNPEFIPRIKHKDGSWRWISGALNNLINDTVVHGVIGNFRDVTKQVTAEQAIRESEIKYHSLIDNAGDGIAIYNAAGTVLDVNTTGLDMLGYTKEEVLKMKVTDFFLEEEIQSNPMTYTKLKPGESTLRQRNFKRKEGGFVLTEVRSQVLPDGNLLSIIRDLTERMAIQEQLRISNDNYSSLVNTIEGIVWEADAKSTQFSFVSMQAEQILGYPAKQWVTEKDFWPNHLHKADREWAMNYCAKYTKEKKSHDFEYRMIAADGRVVWLHDIVTVVAENDEPVKLRGLMIDITEKKIIEKGLEDYKFALNQSSIVDVSDSTGTIQYVNENFCRISGYSMEELKGRDHRILKSGYHSKEHYKDLWNTVASGKVWRAEVKNKAKDGSFYWVDSTIIPFLDDQGKPFQYITIRSDITKRKEAETQILNTLERYDILSKATSDTIWDWDVLNNVIVYNQGIVKNFGYKVTKVKNVKEWWDMNIHPDDRTTVHEAFDKAFQKRKTVVQVEYRYRSADGNYRHILDRAFIIYGDNKKPERMIGSMQDNTNEKEIAIRIEKEVIDAQEREWNQIGMELHDNVNQILAASMLLMGLGKEKMERGQNAASIINESEKHVGEAIAEIRRLSHQLAPVSVANLSLEQVFESLFETVNVNKQVKIKLQMKRMKEILIPHKLQINLYRILQEQLNNIMKHAKATEVTVSFKKIKHSFVFKIADNGLGFDPEAHTSGIGLENIKRRAKVFAGEFKLKTAPGKGCEIVVEIPENAFA